MINRILCLSLLIILFFGCDDPKEQQQRLNFEKKGREVPAFSADSAYRFVEEQVNFGPRNPGSEGHRETKNYLFRKFQSYAGMERVFSQEFSTEGYNGDTLQLTNIIAAFNPRQTDRIMLCAHWDTRPRADKDSVHTAQPIPGADDGASGVGILLELARLFRDNPPPIGVDLILFDGEDYGREGDTAQYFLGSRHWSQNPPVRGYAPRFGILLDMVGGEEALFPKEQYSMEYAPALVNELWSIAEEEGYGAMFVNREGNAISDDHVVINRILGIPTIDVIRHRPDRPGMGFAPYWHTHNDDMDIIDKKTLRGVGEILTELVYNRL